MIYDHQYCKPYDGFPKQILEAKRKRLKMEPKLKVKEKGLLDEAKGPPAPLKME